MVGRVVIKDVFLVAAVEVLGFEIKRRPGWCRSIYPHRLSQGHHGFAHAGESDAELRKRSEEHTSELQSLMRISYAVFCLKKHKTNKSQQHISHTHHTGTTTTAKRHHNTHHVYHITT